MHHGRKVLQEFVKAGRGGNPLRRKPHISTFRLTGVDRMREEIESLGGEIRFEQQ